MIISPPNVQTGALAADRPAKANEISEWNVATPRAMLAVLDTALTGTKLTRETEVWRLRKGAA